MGGKICSVALCETAVYDGPVQEVTQPCNDLKTCPASISMSHWRHRMLDGTKFWISCQWLAFLSILIQNLASSNIEWRLCNVTSELHKGNVANSVQDNSFWCSSHKEALFWTDHCLLQLKYFNCCDKNLNLETLTEHW